MESILRTEQVSKVFNPGTPGEVRALNGITLELKQGEILMIMGPSGSGKTTLITLLGGLLKPSSGKIILHEQEIQSLSSNALTLLRRHTIGFIFQSFNLLQNLTALENVRIAAFEKDNQEMARTLLSRLGLGHRLEAKPSDLSGGERQRVAIARALMNSPEIILADEPTANLDSKRGHEVMEDLCSIGCEQGKSIVIVSHDERIKSIAHRVIYIEDGKITREEEGRHNEVCIMKTHSFHSHT